MQFKTITTVLLTAAIPLASAAPSLGPGIHNVGDPCTSAQIGTHGCPPDGSQQLLCTLNVLSLDGILGGKGLEGQAWLADGSCMDEDKDFFGTCMCNSEGKDCGCVDPSR